MEEEKEGKGLIILIMGLILIMIIAIAGIGYMFYSKGFFDNKVEEKIIEEKEDIEKEFFKAEIKDLVLNVTNGKGREKLMKFSFSIKSIEPTIEVLISENKDEIVDLVISIISSISSEELLTVGGKELLKAEMLDEINFIINEATVDNEDIKKNNIEKLFFTTFVMK
jgi:flagellar FliL protein